MKIILQREGRRAHMTLRGEFDLFMRDPFLAQIEALVAEGIVGLILDMRRVRFLSSTGVSALLRAHRVLARAGGGLVIDDASQPVRETLQQLGLREAVSDVRLPASA